MRPGTDRRGAEERLGNDWRASCEWPGRPKLGFRRGAAAIVENSQILIEFNQEAQEKRSVEAKRSFSTAGGGRGATMSQTIAQRRSEVCILEGFEEA